MLLESLRTKLEAVKGTAAVGSFIPKGEKDPISFMVYGWRFDTLPGRVVLLSISTGSIYIVPDSRWNDTTQFTKMADLATANITPA